MTTNEETGLPELPEGYYWNISEPWKRNNRYRFRLRIFKKLPWWTRLWTLGADDPVAARDMLAPLSDGLVRRTAEELLEDWDRSRVRETDWAYVGNYPPKNLGQGK